MDLAVFVSNPILRGALLGAAVAAAIDLQAFRSWKSFDDLKLFNWKTAAFRWFQGAVIGAISAVHISVA